MITSAALAAASASDVPAFVSITTCSNPAMPWLRHQRADALRPARRFPPGAVGRCSPAARGHHLVLPARSGLEGVQHHEQKGGVARLAPQCQSDVALVVKVNQQHRLPCGGYCVRNGDRRAGLPHSPLRATTAVMLIVLPLPANNSKQLFFMKTNQLNAHTDNLFQKEA